MYLLLIVSLEGKETEASHLNSASLSVRPVASMNEGSGKLKSAPVWGWDQGSVISEWPRT